MRVWFLLLALLLLLPFLDAQKSKAKGKGKNKNQDDRKDNEMREYENSDEREDLQLPRNTMLMEDNDVEMGSMHRMFSGDAGCRVSCKGSVTGMTREDPRTPYYRYIKVDVTSCYDQNTIYPPDMASESHHHFAHWNATVTKLQFRKNKDSNVRQLPKRLSFPTDVESSHMDCGPEGLGRRGECHPTKRFFGFVVFIPRMDMQVKWRVDWMVQARSPYVNMDKENMGYWNYGDCDGEMEDYMSNRQYQENAFSIHGEDGFSFWNQVNNQDEDNNRDQEDEDH